ncbi:sensor histidine kinase [Yinghuangia seranimata]|uniref:sensor histidine kinase n=1 Tax=Yinghuangia seranimata TaxID=408067 RepID=UPI00248BD019|nr:sensor domain-containing protein [Yinghuangia seranimata]MDI2125019.1 sensor domain-containing protein [Yinghuangia seranimata]
MTYPPDRPGRAAARFARLARVARPTRLARLDPRETLLAPVRGLVLFAQKIPEAVLFVLTVVSVVYLGLGLGVLLLPLVVGVVRSTANRSRRLAHAWSGVRIAEPYRPRPQPRPGLVGRLRTCAWILTDPATWRDALWTIADPVVGGVLALLPAALLIYGAEGFVVPLLWDDLTSAGYHDHYLGLVRVEGERGAAAWLMPPLGLACIVLGLVSGPRLLRLHALFTRVLLAPTPGAALTSRVRHLTETRAVAVDAQAAELRRIERDLHDGAQARLVAMGMSLDAAEHVVETDPAAARALLAEARQSSSKILDELRDLVRGIHPPVLADRGLGDAVRALGMDSPMPVEVEVDLPGRLAPPVESAAYFAVSELLTNVVKHARADRAWIDIRYDRDALRITVSDDGRGGADPRAGTGLHGVESRIAAFDGVLALNSPVGGPTLVTLELPCALSSPKTSSC